MGNLKLVCHVTTPRYVFDGGAVTAQAHKHADVTAALQHELNSLVLLPRNLPVQTYVRVPTGLGA